MKTFLPKIFLFALFSILFYLGLTFLWGSITHPILRPNINHKIGSNGHMYSRVKELKDLENGDIDILFLGSSHVYRSFDPRIFKAAGYNIFVLGSSAQTPIQTRFLAKRYLDKINPKLVIYDVSAGTLESDGIESSLDLIANDENDFNSVKMAFQLHHIKTYNTLIYGIWRDLFGLDKEYKEPLKKGNDTYIAGGYVSKKLQNFHSETFEDRTISLKPDQEEALKDIISNLKAESRNFILITVPISPALFSSFTNYDYYDSLMSSYGEYYNFNRTLQLDDSLHFFDRSHLNQNGVNILNKKIIELISEK